MRFPKVALISVATLLLTACTGEKQTKRAEMQQRELFFISQSYPQDVCMSQKLKDELHSKIGLSNVMVSATESSVSCAYFSRTSASCVKFSFTKEYPSACVIAADRVAEKKNEQINGKAVAELMLGLLGK